jgi:hypothetical protein
MTPEDWIHRCAARLRELVQDEGVTLDDLRAVAADMVEDPAYSRLEPEAAAQQQQRDEA